MNVDSEINFAAAEIEELLADGPVVRRGWPTRLAKPLLEMEELEDVGSFSELARRVVLAPYYHVLSYFGRY